MLRACGAPTRVQLPPAALAAAPSRAGCRSAPPRHQWARRAAPRARRAPAAMSAAGEEVQAAPADGAAPDGAAPSPPAWLAELAAREGMSSPSACEYWKSPVQPHGECTIIAALHEGGEPLVRGARVFLHAASRTCYGAWPLGRRVCGHPGLVHGGMSALVLDEMFGQAYWAWYAKERGPGFTANLNVDYKAPAPASEWLCCTVTVESVEGRKVRLAATLSDAPEGKVYAAATCLFIVARKD